MARDHLLLVSRTGYTETYKRFYFRDIQAVIIRKTATAFVGNIVLSILALGFILLAVTVSDAAFKIVWALIGGLFAFLFLLSLWRGSSCVTHIKTAVQTEQLAAWNRMRAARKGMAHDPPPAAGGARRVAPGTQALKSIAQIEDRRSFRRTSQPKPPPRRATYLTRHAAPGPTTLPQSSRARSRRPMPAMPPFLLSRVHHRARRPHPLRRLFAPTLSSGGRAPPSSPRPRPGRSGAGGPVDRRAFLLFGRPNPALDSRAYHDGTLWKSFWSAVE